MALSTIPFSALSSDASNQGVNFRNLIINGDMSIAQRGTSATGITTDGYHTVDRFAVVNNSTGTWTMSQETDAPSGQGFVKSLKMACTTADASTPNYLFLSQRLEGQMLQHLKKGTSNAESLTASFWVKSNKTGTYIVELYDQDNARQISKSYTISSADTWEKKTLTFEGDTTGTFGNDNNTSLQFNIWLDAGSAFTSGTLSTTWTANNTSRAVGQANLADSTSNNFYITGVQLEVGTSASDFEFLPYDVNFQRCKRYYYVLNPTNNANGTIENVYAWNASNLYGSVRFFPPMRTNPSCSMTNSATYYCWEQVTKAISTSDFYSINASSDGTLATIRFYDGNAYNTIANKHGMLENGTFKFNAEL